MNQEWHPTIAGENITIRPIRQTDVELESSFIRRLSAVSKRFRFLGAVRELPLAELKCLCDVDGKDSVAFVEPLSATAKKLRSVSAAIRRTRTRIDAKWRLSSRMTGSTEA